MVNAVFSNPLLHAMSAWFLDELRVCENVCHVLIESSSPSWLSGSFWCLVVVWQKANSSKTKCSFSRWLVSVAEKRTYISWGGWMLTYLGWRVDPSVVLWVLQTYWTLHRFILIREGGMEMYFISSQLITSHFEMSKLDWIVKFLISTFCCLLRGRGWNLFVSSWANFRDVWL